MFISFIDFEYICKFFYEKIFMILLDNKVYFVEFCLVFIVNLEKFNFVS